MTSGSGSKLKRNSKVSARRPRRAWWFWGTWLALMVWLGVEYARLPDVAHLAKERPEQTAMMRARAREAEEAGTKLRFRQRWVGLKRIAPHAVNAVLVSEDSRFHQHGGIDWLELEAAVEKAWRRKEAPRGASTLTQQLAKNLYYGSDRSFLRKGREAIVARRLEEALDKKRILELYLNIAEWGDGVWGIDAAARAHFGVTAAGLSVAQGAMLAAMLPAPRTWTPRKRPSLLKRRAARLVGRLERTGKISASQAAAARVELGFARKAPPAEDPEAEEREEREEREELENLNLGPEPVSAVEAEGAQPAAGSGDGAADVEPEVLPASGDVPAPVDGEPTPTERPGAEDAVPEGDAAPVDAVPVDAVPPDAAQASPGDHEG